MIATVYHLNLAPLLLGAGLFGCCLFVAGWVLRGERDLYRRAHPRRGRLEQPGRLKW